MPKAKKPKTPSVATQLAKWSRSIRDRDGNVCAVCGADQFIQAHHILPKERYPQFRLELMNGVSVCPSHHKFGRLSFHRNPLWSALWLMENRPAQFDWAKERIGK